MSRHAIGVTAILAAGFAGWAWITDSGTTVGIATRVAVLLGAIWIAFPVFKTVNLRSSLIAAVSLLVIVFRPRAAIVVLPVLWWTVGRSSPSRTKRSS